MLLNEIEQGRNKATLFIDMPVAVTSSNVARSGLRKGIIESGKLFEGYIDELQANGMLCSKGGENQLHQLVQNDLMQSVLRIYILGHFRSIRYLLSDIKWGENIRINDKSISVNSLFDCKINEDIFRNLPVLYKMYNALKKYGAIKVPGSRDSLDAKMLMQWYHPHNKHNDKYNLCTKSGQESLVEFDVNFFEAHIPHRKDIGVGGNWHSIGGPMPFTWVKDKAAVKRNLQKNGLLLKHLPLSMQADKKLVMTAVSQNSYVTGVCC